MSSVLVGVIIQTLEPGPVHTDYSAKIRTASEHPPIFLVQLARMCTMVDVASYVNSAVNTIGWADSNVGHIKHYILCLLIQSQPKFIIDKSILRSLS